MVSRKVKNSALGADSEIMRMIICDQKGLCVFKNEDTETEGREIRDERNRVDKLGIAKFQESKSDEIKTNCGVK